jgi:hypothetical protein
VHIQSFVPVLVQSTNSLAVASDPANQVWLGLCEAVDGPRFDELARCYFLALYHFRKFVRRPVMPDIIEIYADDKQQAQRDLYEALRADSEHEVFVTIGLASDDKTLHPALKDPHVPPPSLHNLLLGPGAPPIDALCLMRAFIAAPHLGLSGSPQDVWMLLHSNPSFARACGFLGPSAIKLPGELTSRRLPSWSTCKQFDEVMTRYGLWHRLAQMQVLRNIEHGVLECEDTAVFDTTHHEANSHCDNLESDNAQQLRDAGKKVKLKKVERVCKHCDCGKENWPLCPHPCRSTDQGAAVVVKGPTRVYWAHKSSVMSFADSEIPLDIRLLNYAARSDGQTLLPHLELVASELAQVAEHLRFVLADTAYSHCADELAQRFPNIRLSAPVIGRDCPDTDGLFTGIDHFTPSAIPVCDQGHPFELRGRDITNERFLWVAPSDEVGQPLCASCPNRHSCLLKGARRHIRVDRDLTPQIDWHHPQHSLSERKLYAKRPGVERAIKRIKVDLKAEIISHRDARRVQADLDRKLLTLHLLLEIQAKPA